MSNFSQMLKIREPELLDREDGHWYKTKFDKIYPSISTILSATSSDDKQNSLKAWRENEPAHRIYHLLKLKILELNHIKLLKTI